MVLALLWGLLLGWIAEHRPQWRGRVILGIASSIIGIWIVFAALPTRAPEWLLVILVMIISLGGSGSMLAMDYSRGFIPKERLGSANGFINVGGFLATFVMMWLAGLILDAVKHASGAASAFTFEGFRLALAVQIVVVAFGLGMYLFERRRTARTHRL
jgi:sugar phosphate permease